MRGSSLAPTLTLAEVFGPGVAYLPRRSPNLPGWSPPGPGQVDFLTGLQVGLAGGAAYVACAATVTPIALELRAEAGLPATADLFTYRHVEEYLPLVSRLIAEGYRLAPQRVHHDEEIPPAASHTHPDLLRSLNDKGRMEDVVPAKWLPRRRSISVADLPPASSMLSNGEPVVLKAATERPSGGGHGIWICRTSGEIEAARQALQVESRVVVEEFLDIRMSVCVHGVVYPDGSSELRGCAEEIVCDGRWLGNWHDKRGEQVPEAVLATVSAIVARAALLGYRGIVGIDVALLEDGTWRILDLNFRVNGSTTGAWLRESLEQTSGAPVLLGRTWVARNGFAAMVPAVRAAVRRGTLVPLGFYDPGACSMGGPARLAGLLVGGSRDEVREEGARLLREGLE